MQTQAGDESGGVGGLRQRPRSLRRRKCRQSRPTLVFRMSAPYQEESNYHAHSVSFCIACLAIWPNLQGRPTPKVIISTKLVWPKGDGSEQPQANRSEAAGFNKVSVSGTHGGMVDPPGKDLLSLASL